MSVILPRIGTPEFYKRCELADRTISSKQEKSQFKVHRIPQKSRFGGLRKETADPDVKARAIELMMDEVLNLSREQVIRQIRNEKGVLVTHSCLKNWIWLHRKALKESVK